MFTFQPYSVIPRFSLPSVLDTDACQCHNGAVQSQIHKDGTEQVVAFASRAMYKPEQNTL